MGNQIYKIASSNESLGYPKLYMAPPESKVKELPWATRKAPPESNSNEPKAISVHELQKGIEIKKPYVISLPADQKVYSLFRNRAVLVLQVCMLHQMKR